MKYTPNILLSLLMPFHGKPYIKKNDPTTYRWVALLPEDPDDMAPNMLYVCRLSQAMQLNQANPSCHFACICDRYLSDEEWSDEERLRNIVVIMEESKGLPWLLNLIQNRFLELEAWEKKMQSALIHECDYQQFIDVCEDCFRNSLFVLDNACRLLAHGKQYKSDDPLHIGLYNIGYYPPEIFDLWYSNGRITEYWNNSGVLIQPTGMIGRYETISKWCRYEGQPLVHVILVFSHSPMRPDSVELFDTMMTYFNICFLREHRKKLSSAKSYIRFINEMIYGKLTDRDEIKQAAQRTGIPETGFFDVYRIVFRDNGKVVLGSFIERLAFSLPSSKIVSKDFEISVLNIYNKSNIKSLSQRSIEQIMPLLTEHNAKCGVSAPFKSLFDLSHACRQASLALNYGPSIQHLLLKKNRNNTVLNYSDVYITYMVHASANKSFNVMYNNPYVHKLETLREHDRVHNGNFFDILFQYLICERRATETGAALHMHRSTVMYHIQNISELLDIDLDSYLVRQGLLMAFHFMSAGESIAD